MSFFKKKELKSFVTGAAIGLGGYLNSKYIRWKNKITFSSNKKGDLVIEYD